MFRENIERSLEHSSPDVLTIYRPMFFPGSSRSASLKNA
jgi:hypothetical protein